MTIDLSADFHMHSFYSDGSTSIEGMARAALEKGLHTIAITDHVPLPYTTRYAMAPDQVAAYRAESEQVRKNFAGELTVMTGLEIEYIPAFKGWFGDLAAQGWDVTLASVHTLFRKDLFSLVNGNETEFHKCVYDVFNGDVKALCRTYYETLQAAADTGWFNIAAHLDVLKKHNVGNRFFDETDLWYQDLVQETLDAVHAAGMKMEINMGGLLHPIAQPYPSVWIIRAAMEKGIPIVMGSDSHRPDTIGQGFERIPDLVETQPVFSRVSP